MMPLSPAVDDEPIATTLIFRWRAKLRVRCRSPYLKATNSGCRLQGGGASGISNDPSWELPFALKVHLGAKFHSIANEFRMAVVWTLLTPWRGDQTWTEKSLS